MITNLPQPVIVLNLIHLNICAIFKTTKNKLGKKQIFLKNNENILYSV